MKLRTLQAGRLQCAFDPEEGAISHVMLGEHQVLRGIAALVRDRAWATIKPRVERLLVFSDAHTFKVTFDARCISDSIDFCWHGEISGSEGGLRFTFEGKALRDFERMRIGFCVLHPAALSGQSCAVEHTDRRVSHGHFPREILPHSPFLDIRAISHEIVPGLRAEVRMEGDTFEMEDQRNWTDASFKTYCTPLSLPSPVLLRSGTVVRQEVHLTLHGDIQILDTSIAPPWLPPSEVQVTVGRAIPTSLAKLGTLWNAREPSAPLLSAMRDLPLDFLRINLVLASPGLKTSLQSAVLAAQGLDLPLEIAVYFSEDVAGGITTLARALAALPVSPCILRWLVYHDTAPLPSLELLNVVRTFLGNSAWSAPVGGGAADNFTELNRDRRFFSGADVVTFACNPQVHAFDDTTLVESLAMQEMVARQACELAHPRPVAVSPVTLTRRWRTLDQHLPVVAPPNTLPFQSDPRLTQPLTQAWTVGSMLALSRGGATSATYFETLGDHGLFTELGAPHPAAEAFRSVATLRGATWHETRSSHPAWVEAQGFDLAGTLHLLLVNLGDAEMSVRLGAPWGGERFVLPAYTVQVIES